jgi:uncharacterized membrane protein YtjA (UPF0391 family)
MLKWKHIFLVPALAALALGFSVARLGDVFGMGCPMGAILFSLCLIARLHEQELASCNEQRLIPELAWKPGNLLEQPLSNRQEVAHDPALTMARPH